jgi:hypothetical protein
MEQQLRQHGQAFADMSTAEKEQLWRQAKGDD